MSYKKILRRELIQKRETMSFSEVKRYSQTMSLHLESWLSSNPKHRIFLYSPIRNEPDLTSLIGADPKVTFALPVVLNATDMQFYIVNKASILKANRWGILEPVAREPEKICKPDEMSLVVMPALAADVNGYRLGYGAGFYDRYLQNSKATHMIAVYSESVLETLKHEEHDVRAHYLLTEGGVGEC